MAQYTPPTDEQLHFKVTEDQLPSFKPLFKPFDALTLSPTPIASERRGKPQIINEELLYRLLPPVREQIRKKESMVSQNVFARMSQIGVSPSTRKHEMELKNKTVEETIENSTSTSIFFGTIKTGSNEPFDNGVSSEIPTSAPRQSPIINARNLRYTQQNRYRQLTSQQTISLKV